MGDLMKDDHKTKKQLVYELTELRSQNAALEKSITGIILSGAHKFGAVECIKFKRDSG